MPATASSSPCGHTKRIASKVDRSPASHPMRTGATHRAKRACARGEVDANSAAARVRSRWRIGCGNGPAVLVSRFREAVRCARTREARRRMSSTGSSRMDMTARCSFGRDAAARVPSRSRILYRDTASAVGRMQRPECPPGWLSRPTRSDSGSTGRTDDRNRREGIVRALGTLAIASSLQRSPRSRFRLKAGAHVCPGAQQRRSQIAREAGRRSCVRPSLSWVSGPTSRS